MNSYDGKQIVVIGGSTGIGLTTARMLIDGGARVLITGRNEKNLQAAREQLGERAIAVRSDAGSPTDIQALAGRAEREFGTVDGLLVSAGVNGFAPFGETQEEMFDELFTINVKGPYFTVQAFLPVLARGSSVVLTSSVANAVAVPMLSAYSAGKAAVRAMTRNLAMELLPLGIRVNAVSPGPIDSGILAKTMGPEAAAQTIAQMAAENPMGRAGVTGEVARAVLFLMFDATFTTGAEFPVDGGGSQL